MYPKRNSFYPPIVRKDCEFKSESIEEFKSIKASVIKTSTTKENYSPSTSNSSSSKNSTSLSDMPEWLDYIFEKKQQGNYGQKENGTRSIVLENGDHIDSQNDILITEKRYSNQDGPCSKESIRSKMEGQSIKLEDQRCFGEKNVFYQNADLRMRGRKRGRTVELQFLANERVIERKSRNRSVHDMRGVEAKSNVKRPLRSHSMSSIDYTQQLPSQPYSMRTDLNNEKSSNTRDEKMENRTDAKQEHELQNKSKCQDGDGTLVNTEEGSKFNSIASTIISDVTSEIRQGVNLDGFCTEEKMMNVEHLHSEAVSEINVNRKYTQDLSSEKKDLSSQRRIESKVSKQSVQKSVSSAGEDIKSNRNSNHDKKSTRRKSSTNQGITIPDSEILALKSKSKLKKDKTPRRKTNRILKGESKQLQCGKKQTFLSGLTKEALLKIQEERERMTTFVKCDNMECGKWRRITEQDPLALPNKWFCQLNIDEDFNRCDIPEEDADPKLQNMWIENRFTCGSVVEVKLSGWPLWPAMVDDDPDTGDFFYCNSKATEPLFYHVVFFDSQEHGVTRSWIPRNRISALSKSNSKMDKLSGRIQKAFEIALKALQFDIKERRKIYSFVARYRGVMGQAPSNVTNNCFNKKNFEKRNIRQKSYNSSNDHQAVALLPKKRKLSQSNDQGSNADLECDKGYKKMLEAVTRTGMECLDKSVFTMEFSEKEIADVANDLNSPQVDQNCDVQAESQDNSETRNIEEVIPKDVSFSCDILSNFEDINIGKTIQGILKDLSTESAQEDLEGRKHSPVDDLESTQFIPPSVDEISTASRKENEREVYFEETSSMKHTLDRGLSLYEAGQSEIFLPGLPVTPIERRDQKCATWEMNKDEKLSDTEFEDNFQASQQSDGGSDISKDFSLGSDDE